MSAVQGSDRWRIGIAVLVVALAVLIVGLSPGTAAATDTRAGCGLEANEPASCDYDHDGVTDEADNCLTVPNPGQHNNDGDRDGDACDRDDDNDGVSDGSDNCDFVANPGQADWNGDAEGDACDDTDADGVGDVTDNCREADNVDQADADGDAIGDACDFDDDNDGVDDYTYDTSCGWFDPCDPPTQLDNCRTTPNAEQENLDGDTQGDACDADDDGDGVSDGSDNCSRISNADQTDADADGVGDACDPDADGDGDGAPNGVDNCPTATNPDQANSDDDGDGDACDADDDNDGVGDNYYKRCWSPGADCTDGLTACTPGSGSAGGYWFSWTCEPSGPHDNCRTTPNPAQEDLDGDARGDACDPDDDGDGVADDADNCRTTANPAQTNADGAPDGGDACDPDDDNDGVGDGSDNCRTASNAAQTDTDGAADGGDACDTDDDNDGVADGADNCSRHPNAGQTDVDGDGRGAACDSDGDNPPARAATTTSGETITTPGTSGGGTFNGAGGSLPGSSATLSMKAKVRGVVTRLTAFKLNGVVAGARVRVACATKAKKCPFKRRTFTTPAAGGTVNLLKPVRRARFEVGAVLSIVVTKAGAATTTIRVTFRRGKAPKVDTAA